MKKLILTVLVLWISSARAEVCNPVAIKVDANPVRTSNKMIEYAEAKYKEALLEFDFKLRSELLLEAYLKAKNAFEVISQDRNEIAQAVMKHECPDTPKLLGTSKSEKKTKK